MSLWKFILVIFSASTIAFSSASTAMQPSDDPSSFLSIADIHFDPFITCHNKRPCPIIQKLKQAEVTEWPKILASANQELSQYYQDSNDNLLTLALAAAKKESDIKHVKFVLMLGDFLGHEYRSKYVRFSKDKSKSGYIAFVKKTMRFLKNEFARAFPTQDVYSVIGNNDSYHEDYAVEPHGQFLQDAATLFADLVKNKMNRRIIQKSLPIAGYYAVDIPASPHLRLIVLNSVLFSTKAKGKGVEQAAQEQLNWLHQELMALQANHQKAFIAMHIPVGIDVYATQKIRLFTLIDLWRTKYTQQFQAELKEFAPQISAIFAGHLHSDWFQIQSYGGYEIPVTGTPSISPIFGNNPGFKIYSYSPQTLELGHFVTYYYPISMKKDWRIEHDFKQTYSANSKHLG